MGILDGLGSALDSVKDAVRDVKQYVSDGDWGSAFKKIGEICNGAIAEISKHADGVLKATNGLLGFAFDSIGEVVDSVKNAARFVYDYIRERPAECLEILAGFATAATMIATGNIPGGAAILIRTIAKVAWLRDEVATAKGVDLAKEYPIPHACVGLKDQFKARGAKNMKDIDAQYESWVRNMDPSIDMSGC